MSKGILVDHPKDLAKFIFCTRMLNWKMLRVYLDERWVFFIEFSLGFFLILVGLFSNSYWLVSNCRRDVLDELVTLHNFSNQFLPNALRDFFRHIHAPEERGEYLETLITKFSHRFCACNPVLVREVGLSPGQCTAGSCSSNLQGVERSRMSGGDCSSGERYVNSAYVSGGSCSSTGFLV